MTSADKSLWLNALHDPLTNFSTASSLQCLIDFEDKGDFNLVIGETTKQLKIYGNTAVRSTHNLLERPVAVCTTYSDQFAKREPNIAVAASNIVFLFRNLRPHRKWTCPSKPLQKDEKRVWNELLKRSQRSPVREAKGTREDGKSPSRDDGKDNSKEADLEDSDGEGKMQSDSNAVISDDMVEHATSEFMVLRDEGHTLSYFGAYYLGLRSIADKQQYICYLIENDVELVQHSLITCMTVLKQQSLEYNAASVLVVGTEDGTVYILPTDPLKSNYICKEQLPSTPVLMNASGIFDGEWRVAIATRNGKLYSIKNGESKGRSVLSGIHIDLSAHARCLSQQDALLWVGTTDHKVTCYTTRGKKLKLLSFTSDVVDISTMQLPSAHSVELLLIALKNGEIWLYKDSKAVDKLVVNGPILSMKFGNFGREENTLMIVHGQGSLTLKMWRRTNRVDKLSVQSGPPPEQDVALPVPKKTKLYIEQIEREKENGDDIHRLFQRDLCRLRLETARAYVKTLTDVKMGARIASGPSAHVKMQVKVEGLGPKFVMKMTLHNSGAYPLYNSTLVFSFQDDIYMLGDRSDSDNLQSLNYNSSYHVKVPLLLPSIKSVYENEITNIDAQGRAGQVMVILKAKDSSAPLLSATVLMPTAEPLFDM